MLLRIFFSFFATGGFAVIFKTPKKSIFFAALTGAIGWSLYELVNLKFGYESAIIISSLSIGLLSYFFSYILNTNVHPFIAAGIIPLVPGAPAFFTFQSFIEGNLDTASRYAYETFVGAFGIVIGIAISTAFTNLWERKKLLD
ncbi:threonine/serine exporter family protein [Geotoga petraea]|uniref:Threonine/serine exporter n=1 Tax=Geotoga petraea TaxID=28234 RepID=A0A4Z0W5R4_9BACT|nr:threonine/serine exporter family protein [Geotoga petraea]MDK2946054.1 hypothetical protein [Geotoga sp.]TGG88762.1 threonine/serine exporter [Geotoga petraea]